MARSLGLTAYRALARRKHVPHEALSTARPEGELLWLHAGEPDNLLAVQDLGRRLMGTREGLSVLITVPEPAAKIIADHSVDDAAMLQIAVPSEHPASVQAFLKHWSPDVCVWVWGGLRPNLVFEASERGCPMLLVDADADGFEAKRDRWMPDLTRQLLSVFKAILTRSEQGYRKLQQLSAVTASLHKTSELVPGGQVLNCADSDLDEISSAMGGRPAWFACDVTAKELPLVLSAHQHALRMSHRLLLIIQPQDGAGPVSESAAEYNLTTVNWDDGQFPDDTTQMLITESFAERGLFFRVAPVSFLGGTLFASESRCDPLEAAALGSAILYGPKVRQFLTSYSRLANTGAARIVNDAGALGTAVSRLIAPDQAATMAHAGWDVVSEGAELADRIIDLVQDALDQELRGS